MALASEDSDVWPRTSLGDLKNADLLEMRSGFAQGDHNEEGVGVPHIRPFNVTEDGRISLDKIKYVEPPSDDSPHWLRAGDVIFNNTNSEELTGKAALFESELRCVPSNHITVLRPTSASSMDPYWLAAHLRYLWATGVFRTLLRRYVGQATVSLTRLRDLEIPFPPLEEQRAIAHVLRTVQHAKEATEQVIAAARELKVSLVGEYVTPEETPNTWSTRAIEEVASRVEYGISKRGGPTGHYPILRMNSISNGRVITDDLQWVDLTDDEFRRFKLERGDVLFNRTNSIDKVGKSAYFDLDGHWVFASYLLRVTADETVLDSRFLNYYLGAPSTQTVLKGLATRAVSQANINATKLKSLSMPIPPLSEQHEIANSVQAIDEKIDAEEARRDALATLFDSLLRDLMTARLRVTDLEVSV